MKRHQSVPIRVGSAAKGSSRSIRNDSASLTTSSSSLAWPRGKTRWTETWRLSCSPVAGASRRNSCLTPRSASFRSGLPGLVRDRERIFTADARAGRALSFPPAVRARSGRGLRSAAAGHGRRAIALPGNRRRSHLDARPRRGLRSYVRWTTGPSSRTHARCRCSSKERTVIVHHARVCTYARHARTRGEIRRRLTSAGNSHPGIAPN